MVQVELLLALHDHQPVRVGQLANMLRLAPNTVSGLVQVLLEAGLAARAPDSCDRRVAVVTLTGAGCNKLADWERAHQQRIGNALDQLPPPTRRSSGCPTRRRPPRRPPRRPHYRENNLDGSRRLDSQGGAMPEPFSHGY
jgi:DNA-binding MarR family transcriptional regulator